MHTHRPPPEAHPLQTYRSLVHDVMLSHPSSAVSPSVRLSHTLLSLLPLILLVAAACICWISSDSLHTHTHTLTHTHTHTHTHSLTHTHILACTHSHTHPLTQTATHPLTHSYTYTTGGIPPPLQLPLTPPWLPSSAAGGRARWVPPFFSHDSRRLWFSIRQKDERALRVADRTPRRHHCCTAAWEERLTAEVCLWSDGKEVWGCSVTTGTGHLGAGCHGNRCMRSGSWLVVFLRPEVLGDVLRAARVCVCVSVSL